MVTIELTVWGATYAEIWARAKAEADVFFEDTPYRLAVDSFQGRLYDSRRPVQWHADLTATAVVGRPSAV